MRRSKKTNKEEEEKEGKKTCQTDSKISSGGWLVK